MALTTLDPSTALLVIDLQQGIVGGAFVHPAADVVARAAALSSEFRRHGLPVVLVTVAGAPPGRTEQGPRRGGPPPQGYADLIPELSPRPGDRLITKHARSAFTATGLAEDLRDLGVTQVVLAGISTSSGVESSARDAHEQGFNVTLAIDAMTDVSAERHEHSVARIFPRIGESGTTEEIIDLLDRTRPAS